MHAAIVGGDLPAVTSHLHAQSPLLNRHERDCDRSGI